MAITKLNRLEGLESELIRLLQDVVADNASIGFLPPLSDAEARNYWQDVAAGLQLGAKDLLVLHENGRLAGCAQLSYCSKANGRHRGEVEKVMVHPGNRGKGYGKQLMQAIEATANEKGLSLLVLDTRLGDVASDLYRRMGYQEAGQIPGFALSASGKLDATVFFYKQLTITA